MQQAGDNIERFRNFYLTLKRHPNKEMSARPASRLAAGVRAKIIDSRSHIESPEATT
jgi:hypothetical protein